MKKLIDEVQNWLDEMNEDDYTDALNDLLEHGCQSGMVSELIYYSDTVKFYNKHRVEIDNLLAETLEDLGCDGPAGLFRDKWDKTDPLARGDLNKNLLAWFAFEEIARTLEA